jgi:hypothetical protein
MDKVEYCHVKDYSLPVIPENDPASNSYAMLDAMVKAVMEEGSTNMYEALQSVDIIERMYAAKMNQTEKI